MKITNFPVLRKHDQVTVVLVTYGDRWVYLNRVLDTLNNDSWVSHVVLIDNASNYSVNENCRNALFDKVVVYRNESNLGSAGGFSEGIAIACRMESELILLLDDDVVPQNGSIESLVKTYQRVTELNPNTIQAVTAYRFSQYGKLLVSAQPIPHENHTSFGLNIFNFIHRHVIAPAKGLKKITEIDPDLPRFGTGYAGLLLSRKTIEIIGIPRSDFVLYHDDTEFTLRIIKSGGNIWLDTGSEFDDICDNVSTGFFTKPFLGFILNNSDIKTYYIMRNQIYIERYCICRKTVLYNINFILFITILFAISILMCKFRRSLVLLSALHDGLNGKLGLNPKYLLK